MRFLSVFLLLAACSSPTELPRPVDQPDSGSTCDDGRHNGDETDRDCGGPNCEPCEVNQSCNSAEDCSTLSCDSKCLAATCSDGILNGSEEALDCGGPACGVCESADGGTGGDDLCGDGETTGDEECDDANEDDTDDCVACRAASCGDGFVQAGVEACDDANDDDTDSCIACVAANCGDGFVQTGVEACDDANDDDADDCIACQLATCGDGNIQAGSEDCDDANDDTTDACIACNAAACGDGFVEAGVEVCDDGNDVDTDVCVACQTASCGDGFTQAGVETCDDAGDSATCDADCTAVSCGDGVTNTAAGEQCEGGTGCDTQCHWLPVTYTVTNLAGLVGLTSDCSTTSTFPHTCLPGQMYGFYWTDSTPFTPSAVRVEFSSGNYCSSSRTKNTQLNNSASGQFVLNPSACDCQPSTTPLNTWDLFNLQNYNVGGINTFSMPVQNGCEGIALTNGMFYARITVSP